MFVRSIKVPRVDESITFNLHVRATLECTLNSPLDETLQMFLDSHGYVRIGEEMSSDGWKALVTDGSFEYWLTVTDVDGKLRVDARYISTLDDVHEDYDVGFAGVRREYSFAKKLVQEACTFLLRE